MLADSLVALCQQLKSVFALGKNQLFHGGGAND
jgi:hypothetical protein